ncbi:MAG: hypothetical protein IJI25_01110 [Eubacterium sp.]|nr:hypothetical protein [Eubacterium sp.]
MKKVLLRCLACMLIAALLAAGATGVFELTGAGDVVKASAKPVAISKDSRGYVLAYGDDKLADEGYYSIPADIVCGKITFKKGIYYCSKGCIDLKSSAGPKTEIVNKISSSGTLTRKKYVISKSRAVTKDSVIRSGVSLFTGKYKNCIYRDGRKLSSGYASVDSLMYKVTNGSFSSKTLTTGVMAETFVNASTNSLSEANGIYYDKGTPAKGIYDLTLYENGVPSTYTGWKKADSLGLYNGSKIYYFVNGKALTGWQYLESYGNGKEKYKYNFRKDGTLRTNLFAWKRAYYIKQKLYIKTNLTTHNTTIYVYNKDTKKYDIPAITGICSTSRKKNGTKPIKKTFLQKTSACRWFIYKLSNPWHYYQYGVLIKRSASWYHSTMYKTVKADKMMPPTSKSGYNYLGTNQTTACIRQQAGMAKLIYDIAVLNKMPKASLKKQKERIWVDIYRSRNNGPFGKITLKDSTGTLKKNVRKDPTDPKYGNSLFKAGK